jgi:hypothetical protein
MTIKDIERTITGEYNLSNGDRGQIEGTRDGKTFRTTFFRGQKPSRWWITGTFDPNPAIDLEIDGDARLQVAAPEEELGWKPLKEPEQFHAVARKR